MARSYLRYIEKEDAYFAACQPGTPKNTPLESAVLEEAITWLCRDGATILDFGCGSGGLSFPCVFHGARSVLGIDLSLEAIRFAGACGQTLPQCRFIHGSVEVLQSLSLESFDGVILSNILDNLYPEDALEVLSQCVRLLKPGGKALIKLNPHLTAGEIAQWAVTEIEEDLLDDGLLLWNKPDEHWLSLLNWHFSLVRQEDVYFSEYHQHNRLFLCEKT